MNKTLPTELTLVDDDTIDRHNLQRQVRFSEHWIGELKVEATKHSLIAKNAFKRLIRELRKARWSY
ncbi:hypothetical protein BZG81_11195 [Salinivibrio sp. MA607]|uniref:THIF-type NAD/FAD binding fold domain-containing protein n=1 Tax=Salinivibrio costicola subsp. alcaliphilus TaxID=272773 RepID=A0ABX3KP88_SALCS|nr:MULTISPECIES: ThiF family adenylyltransferase [Salinivibrio]OOF03746.1 hypothetical protein BZG81_11195 [Salinivibrio sp. MA607]OOF33344.1 hypothetical protein BZJ21_11285 [Salinivibrio costicola subsp. alcaliphilus]